MLSFRVQIMVVAAMCCWLTNASAAVSTMRVSVTQANVQGNDASRYCSVSGDGRYVAFGSDATNLVDGDTNSCADVFVKDCETGEIELVTVGPTGAAANGVSCDCTISSNGRYVAFRSHASNLVDGDTNGVLDVFVRDLQTDTTQRVSVSSSGAEGNAAAEGNRSLGGAGSFTGVDISGDGRYVVFESYASNLVDSDTNSQADVFVRDRTAGTTTRVNRRWDGTESRWAYGPPTLSNDGRFVAYTSADNYMVEGTVGAGYQVYVYDTQTQTNVMASRSADGSIANDVADSPDLSANGRYVAFSSKATNLVPDTSAIVRQVYVKDLQTGAIFCPSVDNEGALGWGDSRRPSISGDGTRISFESLADNLFPDGGSIYVGVFLHDRNTQTTYWASPTTGGWSNGPAQVGRISLDGRYVAYHAGANNLVADDTNSVDDAFRFDFGPIAYQPDGLIHNGEQYIGGGIYNADGTDQTHTLQVAPRRSGTYQVRFESDANAMDCLTITGTAGGPSSGTWRVRYYSGSDGSDITAAVTGAGWTTASLRPGKGPALAVEVIPPEGAAEDSEMPVLVTATSATDGTKSDTVKALTVCRVTRGVDGVIRDGSQLIGDGVVNADGSGQTVSQGCYAADTAAYEMLFYNEGNAWDTLRVTGTVGGGDWTVRYVEYWSQDDITAQVTGAGWQTTALAPGAGCRVRLYVTPQAGTAPTSSLAALVTATSVGNGTTADTVKAETTCVPLYRPDGQIHNGAEYIGDNIYSPRAAGQTYERSVAGGTTATYYVACQNDGTVPDSLSITGTAGNSLWSVQYQEYWSRADITADVTGAGWQPPALAPGAMVRLRLLVTPLAGAPGNIPFNVAVTATSGTEATARDTVKAVTTCIATYRPDGQIHDGAAYIGDGIYNTTGAGQTHSLTRAPGVAARYAVFFSNDGNALDTFSITGTAGTAVWDVQYLDVSTGADITADVTGGGWQSPALKGGRPVKVTILVTPGAAANGGSSFPVALTAASVADGTKRDTVKAVTTCGPTYRPDGHIWDGSSYLGDDIYNTTGAGQTATLWTSPGVTVTHFPRLQNDGNTPRSLLVKGTAGNRLWTVRYLEYWTGDDITADVTGDGWTTPSLRSGASCRIKVEVTPLAGVVADTSLVTTIAAISTDGYPGADAVKAVTSCRRVVQPDGQIWDGSLYLGDDIYNTTAVGQTTSGTVALGGAVTCYVRVENDGNAAEPFVVTGPAGDSKWTVQYLEYRTGVDITAAVTGAGWTTAPIAPGRNLMLKVLVIPGASSVVGDTSAVALTATSLEDAGKRDTVKAEVTRR